MAKPDLVTAAFVYCEEQWRLEHGLVGHCGQARA